MDFLNREEITTLTLVLMKKTFLETADAVIRRDVLNSISLSQFCSSLPLNTSSTFVFVTALCARLSQEIPNGETTRLGLIVLLEHLKKTDPVLSANDKAKKFIERVIKKYDEAKALKALDSDENDSDVLDILNELRSNSLTSFSDSDENLQLRQKIIDLQENLTLLGREISELKFGKSLEISKEERTHIEHRIYEISSERQGIERDLKNVEIQLAATVVSDESHRKTEHNASPIIIDKRKIVDFNLREFRDKFWEDLKYKGVFALTLGSEYIDEKTLKDYLIERLLGEFSKMTGRSVHKKPFELRIHPNISHSEKIIERLIARYSYKQVCDMFEESCSDIVIVIWCYKIPVEKIQELQSIATSFWNTIKQTASTCFGSESRTLLLIWVNLNDNPLKLDAFTALPTPDILDVAELKDWFKGLVREYKDILGDEKIQDYVERLEMPEGHLATTYIEMNDIIQEINREGIIQ